MGDLTGETCPHQCTRASPCLGRAWIDNHGRERVNSPSSPISPAPTLMLLVLGPSGNYATHFLGPQLTHIRLGTSRSPELCEPNLHSKSLSSLSVLLVLFLWETLAYRAPFLLRVHSLPSPSSHWLPFIYLLTLWRFLFWRVHIDGIIHVGFCVWLISLSIMLSAFIRVVLPSFVLLHHIPLYR